MKFQSSRIVRSARYGSCIPFSSLPTALTEQKVNEANGVKCCRVFAVVGMSLYIAAKKTLTVPRIGFVKLATYRVKAMQTLAIGMLSLFALLGVVAFMQTEGGGTPAWLLFAIENHMLVIGVSIAASFCAAGYTFRTNRMYGYALLALVMFVVGHYLYYPLYYYMILLGSLILLFGLATLIRFVRRNPPTAGSIGDRGNEEQ